MAATTPAFSSLTDDTPVETLESVALKRRSKDAPSNSSTSSKTLSESPSHPSPVNDPPSLDETAEEASQEGAFNEETGEINWDCPCLGGMAHGPCGDEFRAAFSCFVFSKEDPKGMDCIENFKGMQDCFRQHPETYGSELDDDDDEGYEGDDEPPASETVDSTNSRPSARDRASLPDEVDQPSTNNPPPSKSTPSNEVDQPSANNLPPPKSTRLHPQVDEPSIYPQTPSDPPQRASSSASQSGSPNDRASVSEPPRPKT